MYRYFILIVIILASFTMWASPAYACQGWLEAPHQKHIDQSDRAFIGRVIKSYDKKGTQITVFHVSSMLHGRYSKKIKIYQAGYRGNSCAIKFYEGKRYVVAARLVKRKLITDSHYARQLVDGQNYREYKRIPRKRWLFW